MRVSLSANDDQGTAEAVSASLRRPLWPGMMAMTAADRRQLAGRESDVNAILEVLQRPVAGESPVVWLHGDSGVGKTSLALAGVMPRWSSDYGQRLVWFRLSPEPEFGGRELIETIAEGILREVTRGEESTLDLAGRLRQFTLLLREDSSEEAAEYLAACFRRSTPTGAVGALFIDQFGRCLGRLREREDEAIGALLRFLRDLSLTGQFPLLIALRSFQLATVRGALSAAGLGEFGDWVRIDRPPPESLSNFLASAPSDRHPGGRMRVAEPVVASLRRVLEEWPSALPLANELLATISREDPYAEEIDEDLVRWHGGLERVFADAADRAVAQFDSGESNEWENVFDRLMTLLDGEAEVRAVPFSRIAPESDEFARSAVIALNNERVLHLSGDSLDEVVVSWTYPPGLAAWKRAADWSERKRRLDARVMQFDEARERWEAERRTPVCLIHATRLIEDAHGLLRRHRFTPCLKAPLVEYLENSIELDARLRGEMREKQTRRWFWIGGSAAAAIVLLFVMLVMAR